MHELMHRRNVTGGKCQEPEAAEIRGGGCVRTAGGCEELHYTLRVVGDTRVAAARTSQALDKNRGLRELSSGRGAADSKKFLGS